LTSSEPHSGPKVVRVGAGAGFAGDRIEPAVELVREGRLDYLVFECLAERTIALAQRARLDDPGGGYDPLLEARMRAVLPLCVEKGVRIVSNMGAANPAGAARLTADLARRLKLGPMRVATVLGDDVFEYVRRHADILTVMETGLPVAAIDGELIAANAYLGADPIVTALRQGADVVITGRVADCSLFLAPMIHEFGWALDDWARLGQGQVCADMVECGANVSGGFFADPGYKAVAEGIKDKSRIVYALHPRAEQPFLDDLVDGVKAAGYKAITFVSEGAYYSRRERDLMSGLATKAKRSRTYASYLQQMRDERASGKTPSKEGLLGTIITWEMLERVKSRSGLPLILKGVTNAQDARLAMEHGVDVIYVSNHGGRSLDHARGTIQSLPDVVDAVKGKVDIIVDGGFVRGSDVLKAVAMGAKAVSMGRMQSWALAAAGQTGLTRMLEILEEEIIVAMGLLGVTKLDQLNRDYVTPTHPVTQPHPLSAFPVVMERIAKE